MKRNAAVILVLVLAAAAGGWWIFRQRGAGPEGLKLAPAETVFFVDVPDIARTRVRWKQTALYELKQEPEVQAFLEKPVSQTPGLERMREGKAKFLALKPREVFLAVTSITTDVPKVVAGLKFDGKKEDLDPMLEDARAALRAEFPAGKDDLTKYGDAEMETFSRGQGPEAEWGAAYEKGWYLVANDVGLLKATLDRLEGKGDAAGALGGEAHFKTSAGYLPNESDVFFFAQLQSLAQRLESLVKAAGGQISEEQEEKIRNIQAVAGALKMEGNDMRDAIFVLNAEAKKEESLARGSLALTSTNTLLYYAGLVHIPGGLKMPAGGAAGAVGVPAAGWQAWLGMARQALSAQGLDRTAFAAAFGPEYGTALDWAAGNPQPGLLFSMDIRDAGKAAKFLDGVMASPLGTGWARRKIDGTTYYGRPSAQIPMLTPTLALTGKTLLAGLSFEDVKGAVETMKNPADGIEKTPLYKEAEAKVRTPTAAFGYIDTAALCERVYGTLRPFAMIWVNFAPKLRQFMDPEKLPQTETLTRHLGPIIRSESGTEDGTLIESAGPITFNELLLGIGLGAGAAAVPAMKSQGFPYWGMSLPVGAGQGSGKGGNGP